MEVTSSTGLDRYTVTIDEYVSYRRDGFLIVRGLLSPADTSRLQAWTDDIYSGRETSLDHLHHDHSWQDGKKPERLSSARLHQPHNENATAEWGLLHPRVLDVLEALIGPDVLALQSMMFFNPPGKGGQGWHQDSFYIQTQPDSLIGAWIALDRADEENGCLWVAPGSHHEPVYPPEARGHFVHATETVIDGLFTVQNASHMDDEVNNLSGVAAKYGSSVPVVLEPGDVLFFHSHLLHRSYVNRTSDRYRRSYVTHYCNARSWVPWSGSNERHILARGRTHLPFATPKFGTPVILSPVVENDEDGGSMMVAMPGGDMGKMEMG
ncbi:phytanoyl-CoA dioxygenase family protein [Paenibacillus koleovorans]|uniref:phytanoyl-CoA dioxygenase family protein n=1 Tax=Paenibacillus koleovorans TaxID=121608 RepID=UPI000FDA61E1|nr:phytanoyl-CoA dioxygenase family protein [Paenibacillus koleovorans]